MAKTFLTKWYTFQREYWTLFNEYLQLFSGYLNTTVTRTLKSYPKAAPNHTRVVQLLFNMWSELSKQVETKY